MSDETAVGRCYAVLRTWDEAKGLIETEHTFADLASLFAFCTAAHGEVLIDRLVIEGEAEGQPHTLTFVFQSLGRDER
jgi:hypothetical protein